MKTQSAEAACRVRRRPQALVDAGLGVGHLQVEPQALAAAEVGGRRLSASTPTQPAAEQAVGDQVAQFVRAHAAVVPRAVGARLLSRAPGRCIRSASPYGSGTAGSAVRRRWSTAVAASTWRASIPSALSNELAGVMAPARRCSLPPPLAQAASSSARAATAARQTQRSTHHGVSPSLSGRALHEGAVVGLRCDLAGSVAARHARRHVSP